MDSIIEKVREFFSSGVAMGVAGFAGFLVLLLILQKLLGLFKNVKTAAPSQKLGFLPRVAYRHTAKKAMADGQFLRAADFYYQAGDFLEAAEAHLRGRNYVRAGEIFAQQKKFKRAAEAYERGGDPLRAAQLFASFGNLERAEENYLKAGKMLAIAEMYQQAMQFNRAGEYFEKISRWRQAAEMFARGNNFGAAARALDRLCVEGPGAGRHQYQQQEIQGFAGRAADLYVKNEEPEKAAQLLERLEMFEPAANILMECNAFKDAGEIYLKGRHLEQAAKAFERAGMKDRALTVQAELYQDRKEYKKAAAIYTRIGQEESAAQMYEKIRDYRSAARHYFKAKKYQRAGDLYARIQDYIPAGKAFEAAKNYQSAADCFRRADDTDHYIRCLEKGGNYFKAGEKYFELGRLDEAVAALQKVRPKQMIFKRACFIQGLVFRERGELALAARKMEQAIETEQVTSNNIDIFYEYGETLLTKGDDDKALPIFEKVKSADYHYRDVAEKVDQLIQKMKIASQGPANPHETTSRTDAFGPSYVLQGRYEIIEKIGKGGMGTIFKVKDTLLDRIVAYKILAADLAAHPKAFQSFLQEAKAAASLHHPNIVTLFDIGETGGEYFITMEYVKGATLASILKDKGRLPLRPSVAIVHQVCEALAYAHGRKLVHRDIKPSNIMVDDQFKVKIFDFGLAKIIEDKSFSTSKIAGTPHYMSPEQVVGESIDFRTDIYSLGVTFYHLVTGQTPFKGKDVGYHHLHTQPTPPSDLVSDLPPEMDDIIMTAMEKDKRNRFKSAEHMKVAVKQLLK